MSATATNPSRRYVPRGAALDLFHCQEPEVLLSGPAGTGKSLACLWKLHYLASKVPGLRALMLRKTRESMTESVLVTFERDVLPDTHPAKAGPHRSGRRSYRYPNGSEIVVSGLRQAGRDMTQKVMSTDYDVAYVAEAIELEEAEWEKLTTRLGRGRRLLPFAQLIADTNPDTPRHWLKRRCDAGRTQLMESRHKDNPTLWTGEDWTPDGAAYIAKLDALTGPRKLRLRFGRWVQAEGVVYEGWEPAVHLIDRFAIPPDWPRLWSVDFGYSNPFVWQAWALDPDDRLFRYREIYRTRRLVEDHARRILELTAGEPDPAAIVCDHDAEDRATLERHLGLETTPANKERSPGFQAVAARLARAGNGKPRLFFLRDSLDERDADLDDAKRPCCTEEEFDGYVWRTGGKEEPVKENDHGMDAMRYCVWSFDCTQGLEATDVPQTVLRP
jgi:hypothetical protein